MATVGSVLFDLTETGDFERIVDRAHSYPQEAKFQDEVGDTPLHKLIYENDNVPIEALKAIYNAYPSAIQMENSEGFTPVDVAIRLNSMDDMIDFLKGMKDKVAEVTPSTSTADVNTNNTNSRSFVSTAGPKLYDYAFNSNFTDAIKRAVSHPHEAEYQSDDGNTALHWLAYYNAPLEAVQAVVKAYPGTLQIKDHDGHTPLDIAVHQSSASEDVIEFLSVSDQNLIREALENLFSLQTEVKRLTQNNIVLSTQVTSLTDLCTMLRNDNDAAKDNFEMQELASKKGMDVETYKTVESVRNEMEAMRQKESETETKLRILEDVNREMAQQMINMKTLLDNKIQDNFFELLNRISNLDDQVKNSCSMVDEMQKRENSLRLEHREEIEMLKRDNFADLQQSKQEMERMMHDKMATVQLRIMDLMDDRVKRGMKTQRMGKSRRFATDQSVGSQQTKQSVVSIQSLVQRALSRKKSLRNSDKSFGTRSTRSKNRPSREQVGEEKIEDTIQTQWEVLEANWDEFSEASQSRESRGRQRSVMSVTSYSVGEYNTDNLQGIEINTSGRKQKKSFFKRFSRSSKKTQTRTVTYR